MNGHILAGAGYERMLAVKRLNRWHTRRLVPRYFGWM